ncbi:MAG: hypothetical protein LBM64_06570 [Deltaproteobacteria bacterium]|nr:hypothetical protein [Deltaproteobacteria bacterium]
MYTSGLSLNSIARMFKVSTPAVSRWVRLSAERTYEKPKPREAVVVELDEPSALNEITAVNATRYSACRIRPPANRRMSAQSRPSPA